MTINKEPLYWKTNKEWYCINHEKDCYELTDKAPDRAKKSFELFKKGRAGVGERNNLMNLDFLDEGQPVEAGYADIAREEIAKFLEYCRELNKRPSELSQKEREKWYQKNESNK